MSDVRARRLPLLAPPTHVDEAPRPPAPPRAWVGAALGAGVGAVVGSVAGIAAIAGLEQNDGGQIVLFALT